MNCSFAEEQILASLDAPLPEAEGRALREHLAGCEACAKFQRVQLAADRALASHFAEVVAGTSSPSTIRDAAFLPKPAGMPAWLPDLLNAAGVAFVVGSLTSLGWATTYSTFLLVGMFLLIGIVCYPLLLLRTE